MFQKKLKLFHPGKLLRNVFTVGGLTFFSRILGLVREMMQSRLIGAGIEQSAFVLAFAIPNMTRKLFGEGALTAAFVPVFKGELERGDMESARRLGRAVLMQMLLILGSISILSVMSLTAWLNFIDDGMSERLTISVKLIRILLPYMFFICAAAFGMGVMNSLGRFSEGAFMPALLNVFWIAALGILCFFPGASLSDRVTAVCWAILIGGAAQMLFLFRCLIKRGMGSVFGFRGIFSPSDEKVRLVWRNTFLAALGASAIQVNYMLDQVLAQCAAPWAAGVIGYAERLIDLPLGVVAVAFGTVLLPTFSGEFAKNDLKNARRILYRSLLQVSALMIPAAIVVFFFSRWIVSLIYEGSAFGPDDTIRVARALSIYGIGLPFFAAQKCLIPFFQAQGDMKTTLRITVETVVLNAVLNILAVVFLPEEWRHVGLAASTSFCAFVGCVIYWWKISFEQPPIAF